MKKNELKKQLTLTSVNEDLQYLAKIDYAGEILDFIIKQKKEIHENIELIKVFDGEKINEKKVISTLKRLLDVPLKDLEKLKTLD